MPDSTHNAASIYRVFGLRRSGNHAFIHWLHTQLEGNTWFYNNVYLDDLFRHAPDRRDSEGEPDHLLFSFEDRDLEVAARTEFLARSRVAPTPGPIDFIVLRDPLNLFASRVKAGMTEPLFYTGMTVPELTHQYFRCAEGAGPWAARFGGRLVPVTFDRFIASEDYRAELAASVGLKAKPADLAKVDTRYGGGSSFGRGNPEAPSVDELRSRWKGVSSDSLLRRWVGEFATRVRECPLALCDFDPVRIEAEGMAVEPPRATGDPPWHGAKLCAIRRLRTSRRLKPLRDALKWARRRAIRRTPGAA